MGKGDGSAGRKGKLPPNCYWRGEIIWARFKVGGVEYRESLRTSSPAVADRRLRARKQQVQDAAIYGQAAPMSWQAAVVEWRAAVEQSIKPGTLKRYLCSLRIIGPMLEEVDVQEVTPAKIREIVATRRRQKATNATIRRDLTAISSVLAHAVAEGLMPKNHAREYDRQHVKERRDPITLPDAGDVEKVAAKAPGAFADMIRFARATGMRQEEIASLTHRQVDKARGVVTLYATKNGRPRAVPLSAEALAILARRPAYLGSPFVFWHGEGERYANVSSRFAAIVARVAQQVAQKKGEFRRFRFHDLRHLYAVEELHRGRSIYELQGILGHSSIRVTEMYLDYLTPEEAALVRGGTPGGTVATVRGIKTPAQRAERG